MGGSSLAPEVFRRSNPPAEGALRLHVLDSTEPLAGRGGRRRDRRRDARCSSSRRSRAARSSRTRCWPTSAGCSPTRATSSRSPTPAPRWPSSPSGEGFRHTFLVDPEIGGRYSALSPFGLVPAALAGRRRRRRCSRARRSRRRTASCPRATRACGSARRSASSRGAAATSSRSSSTRRSSSFGLWAEQLVAESTGKQGRGILPIADEPLVDPGAYGDDRVFVHLRDADAPDARHARGGRGARRGRAPDDHPHGGAAPSDLGRLFFFSEFATAVAGWALEINPFDQPNVQEAKDNTAQGARAGRAGRLQDGVARRAARRARAAAATSRSWATCPTTTRSTRRSRGCGRR